MKKSFLIIGLSGIISLAGMAQTKNVDIDNVWITFAFRALPQQPQKPVHFTYSVHIDASNVAEKNLQIDALQNSINIEGQMRATDSDAAQMAVEISVGDIIIKSSDVKERKEDIKDRDGKVTGTNVYYSIVVTYTFDAVCRIMSDGKELTKMTLFARNENLTYVSSEYQNRKSAIDFWNNNRDVLVAGFYRDLASEFVKKTSTFTSSRFGFQSLTNQRFVIKTMDEKKHSENSTFRAAAESLRNVLQAATPDISADRERLAGLAEYFKSIPTKYTDPKLKADVRIRYAAYFNLCMIYLYGDEPEKVGEYADLIIANGYDQKDGEQLNKNAKTLIELFDKTGIRTRHFDPESYFQ